ncbi:hypothetical protein [Aegicerativicinus sediminis]|uniref:hypothetical protein n=1 Tax=Aegicerativicinus sediminis TaxID=2893202 RepID=UPI001E5597BE|nr:hypothetical protein [Aegicerativicinus sediminis]
MIKKDILIGLIAGFIANTVGLFFAAWLLGDKSDVIGSIKTSLVEDFFGKLVSIGAVFNLLLFFYFLRRKKDYKARGVVLATLLIAIITFIVKFR